MANGLPTSVLHYFASKYVESSAADVIKVNVYKCCFRPFSTSEAAFATILFASCKSNPKGANSFLIKVDPFSDVR